jgi:hypothetical protein
MTSTPLDLTDLDEWVSAMAAVPGLKSATRNPGALRLPGVLVQVVGLGVDTLGQDEWRVDLNLVIVTGESDVIRATDALVDLLNAVRSYLGHPAGDYTPRPYRNDQGVDFPALNVPHTVRITTD